MTTFEIVQILSGTVGVLGFSVLFNIRGKRMAMTVLGGFLSWLLFVIFSKFISSEPINFFLVALIISFYAEIMARVLRTPTTTFITAALVPLIPGSSLYYTMAYAFQSDSVNFVTKAVDTLKLASALALGIIIATSVTRLYFEAKRSAKKTTIR